MWPVMYLVKRMTALSFAKILFGMGRKIRLSRILIFTLLVAAVATLFFPVQQKEELEVDAGFNLVYRQISDVKKWDTWLAPLKDMAKTVSPVYSGTGREAGSGVKAGEVSFTLKKAGPLGIVITDEITRGSHIIVLQETETSRTKVSWTAQVSLWRKLFSAATPGGQSLKNLKSFIEDPRQFYGYAIEIRPVADTVVAIMQGKATEARRLEIAQQLFTTLKNYAEAQNLGSTGAPILTIIPQQGEELLLVAGWPVSRRGAATAGISYMGMPRGRMLVGSYEGPYSQLKNLYQAMRQCISDRNHEPVASPFEKLISGFGDTSRMKIELWQPIF